MGEPTDDKYMQWLRPLGVNQPAGGGAPAATGVPSPFRDPAAAGAVAPGFNPMDPNVLRGAMQAGMKSQEEADAKLLKEAEGKLAVMKKALVDVEQFLGAMDKSALQQSSYAAVVKDMRKRFPEVAELAQWVKDTTIQVPKIRGKLPSPGALMDVVSKVVKDRGVETGWNASSVDPTKLNTDRLLAAYASQLPSGIDVNIKNGVVSLSATGAAVKVAAGGGEVEAKAGKGGASVGFQNNDFAIQVSNEGLKDFDPTLRGRWQKISDEAATLVTLEASRDKLKAELTDAQAKGGTVKADVQVKFDEVEAKFNLAWKHLQEELKATAEVSDKKLSASVDYLKKDGQGNDSVKAGGSAEVELTTMKAKLTAYYATPTVKAALEVTRAADRVTASLEVAAVKSGVVVTAGFEHALKETKAKIEVALRDADTKIVAELTKKADDLEAKVKVVRDTKDLKLAVELEKTLKEVRVSVEAEFAKGPVKGKVSAGVTDGGKVSGKAQVDIELQGMSFAGSGGALSFAADVSSTEYKFSATFSIGKPVSTQSVQNLFDTADKQIKELYRLAGDQGIRSIADAAAIQKKFKEVLAPIDAAAKAAEALKGKQQITASLGFEVQGTWPSAGSAPPPSTSFNITVHF